MAQNVFERCEKKYMLDTAQYTELLERLSGKTAPDRYGRYTICNLYYDTDRYDLIRESIGKPVYKEKLRLRSYGRAERAGPVFVELKKKFRGVVYKRRATLAYEEARRFLGGGEIGEDSQILREIGYFIKRYPLSEKVYISYDRTALAGTEDGSLRITFDTGIRFRRSELRLESGTWGTDILEPGNVLMEVKNTGAFPLWLCRMLSELAVFPISFSKYGLCYSSYIAREIKTKTGVTASA